MAHEYVKGKAVTGTDNRTQSPKMAGVGCPTWDSLNAGSILPPFFKTSEELKRKGFQVRFLADHPRRETDGRFNEGAKELWFDIECQGEVMTWTISQLSLLVELKRHEPLSGKRFDIKLVPVDEDFRQKRPKNLSVNRSHFSPADDGRRQV